MKKMMGLICVVLTLSLLPILSACGGGKDMSNSPYVGKWTATTASMSGISLKVEDLFANGFTLDLKKDGKVELNIDGEITTGSWDETDKGFNIEKEFDVVVDGSTGTMDYSGVTLVFQHEA